MRKCAGYFILIFITAWVFLLDALQTKENMHFTKTLQEWTFSVLEMYFFQNTNNIVCCTRYCHFPGIVRLQLISICWNLVDNLFGYWHHQVVSSWCVSFSYYNVYQYATSCDKFSHNIITSCVHLKMSFAHTIYSLWWWYIP